MKVQVYRKRTDRSFVVDGIIYVKLQPYRKFSLKGDSFQKLAAKFFGPLMILARVGPVAYTLELPPQSKIHPTFIFPCSKRNLAALL